MGGVTTKIGKQPKRKNGLSILSDETRETCDCESGEFCACAGDVIPLSEAAEEKYHCNNPVCHACSNEAECTKLHGHLSSHFVDLHH